MALVRTHTSTSGIVWKISPLGPRADLDISLAQHLLQCNELNQILLQPIAPPCFGI